MNGKEISRAGPNVKRKEVEFEFLKGDTITIKEVNVGIIKLNSLQLKESDSWFDLKYHKWFSNSSFHNLQQIIQERKKVVF